MSQQEQNIQEKQGTQVVLVEGHLRKIIHQQGQGDSPVKGQQVSALYRGTLESGQQFDSNQDRDSPFKFTVGVGQVIKAWDEGFISMKRGEKATLICSPQYGYGARGSPPRIPPNSVLHFQVQLLDFQDKKKEKWELSTEEKVEEATKFKAQGNQHLKHGNNRQAIKSYESGIQYVDFETDQAAKNILRILRMNISQAYINNKQYGKAIQACNKVLQDDNKNVKSLYRRGVAYGKNQDFEKAKTDLRAILEIDPNHEQSKKELLRIANEEKQLKQKEKKIFGGMFAKSGLYDDKKPQEKKKPAKSEESEEEQMPDLEKDEPIQNQSKEEPKKAQNEEKPIQVEQKQEDQPKE